MCMMKMLTDDEAQSIYQEKTSSLCVQLGAWMSDESSCLVITKLIDSVACLQHSNKLLGP